MIFTYPDDIRPGTHIRLWRKVWTVRRRKKVDDTIFYKATRMNDEITDETTIVPIDSDKVSKFDRGTTWSEATNS